MDIRWNNLLSFVNMWWAELFLPIWRIGFTQIKLHQQQISINICDSVANSLYWGSMHKTICICQCKLAVFGFSVSTYGWKQTNICTRVCAVFVLHPFPVFGCNLHACNPISNIHGDKANQGSCVMMHPTDANTHCDTLHSHAIHTVDRTHTQKETACVACVD